MVWGVVAYTTLRFVPVQVFSSTPLIVMVPTCCSKKTSLEFKFAGIMNVSPIWPVSRLEDLDGELTTLICRVVGAAGGADKGYVSSRAGNHGSS